MYARGNPLRHNDPSGHCVDGISTAICIGATVGFVAGAGLYLWSESHQADGIDLSIGLTWGGGMPGLKIGNDWGDLLMAGGSGAVAGALIPLGGVAAGAPEVASAMGASMVGNLAADHLGNLLTGDNFSATGHFVTGAVGLASGIAAPGVGAAIKEVPALAGSSTLVRQGVSVVGRGLAVGLLNGVGDYGTGAANDAGDFSKLPGDLAWGIITEGYGKLGEVNPGNSYWESFLSVTGNLIQSGSRKVWQAINEGGNN